MINIKPIEDLNLKDDNDWSVYIDETKIEYYQKGDTVNTLPKRIEISAINNGVARFMHIKTDENGWSFTDENELIELINDFKKRAKL